MATPTTSAQPTPTTSSQLPPNHYPLFKGATRVATVKGGVPTRAFVGLVFLTVVIAMFIRIWGWLVFPALYPIVAVISRNDDRAFWILELWWKTKFTVPNKAFWGAVTYTPTPYSPRRPWLRLFGNR